MKKKIKNQQYIIRLEGQVQNEELVISNEDRYQLCNLNCDEFDVKCKISFMTPKNALNNPVFSVSDMPIIYSVADRLAGSFSSELTFLEELCGLMNEVFAQDGTAQYSFGYDDIFQRKTGKARLFSNLDLPFTFQTNDYRLQKILGCGSEVYSSAEQTFIVYSGTDKTTTTLQCIDFPKKMFIGLAKELNLICFDMTEFTFYEKKERRFVILKTQYDLQAGNYASIVSGFNVNFTLQQILRGIKIEFQDEMFTQIDIEGEPYILELYINPSAKMIQNEQQDQLDYEEYVQKLEQQRLEMQQRRDKDNNDKAIAQQVEEQKRIEEQKRLDEIEQFVQLKADLLYNMNDILKQHLPPPPPPGPGMEPVIELLKGNQQLLTEVRQKVLNDDTHVQLQSLQKDIYNNQMYIQEMSQGNYKQILSTTSFLAQQQILHQQVEDVAHIQAHLNERSIILANLYEAIPITADGGLNAQRSELIAMNHEGVAQFKAMGKAINDRYVDLTEQILQQNAIVNDAMKKRRVISTEEMTEFMNMIYALYVQQQEHLEQYNKVLVSEESFLDYQKERLDQYMTYMKQLEQRMIAQQPIDLNMEYSSFNDSYLAEHKVMKQKGIEDIAKKIESFLGERDTLPLVSATNLQMTQPPLSASAFEGLRPEDLATRVQ